MKKIVLSVILIFFVSLSSARVYGYYEDSQTTYLSQDETRIKIVESMHSNNGMNLVPTGAILGVNDTEQITFTYKIFIQDGIDFEYYIQNITVNNEFVSKDVSDIFIFDYEVKELENENIQVDLFDSKLDGRYVEITVTLSMAFPTEEQFNLISGQQLRFEFFVETGL